MENLLLGLTWPRILMATLPAIGGGLVSTATGFGGGIFVMQFYPFFLSVVEASCLSTTVFYPLTVSLAYKYRKYADRKLVWFPAIFYIATSFVCIRLSTRMDMSLLKTVFGGFLVLIAIYFMFFSSRIRIRANPFTAIVCAVLAGALGGFFGIGGPPMVIYFLSIAGDDINRYFGTTQLYFMITGFFNIFNRAINGIYTVEILLLSVLALAGVFLGKYIGTLVVERLNVRRLKLCIYGFLALSGVLTMLSGLR